MIIVFKSFKKVYKLLILLQLFLNEIQISRRMQQARNIKSIITIGK